MTDRVDNAPRKSWYGEGRQPWDTMVEETPWAVAFAAATILRYLRRPAKQSPSDEWFNRWVHPHDIAAAKAQAIKEVQAHSLESARWYYKRLYDWANESENTPPALPRSTLVMSAKFALDLLRRLLKPEEWEQLAG